MGETVAGPWQELVLEFGPELQVLVPDPLIFPGLCSFWPFHCERCLLPLGQMLTFIMLARLATLCPAPVLQRVDRLIEPLRATCTAKVSPPA